MVRTWTIVAMLAAGALHATTVPPMTPTELRAAADLVVDGEVTGSECRRVGRRILTFVTVVSMEPTLRTTLVAIPGGVVDGVAQVVPGAPVLEPGVRYRLYLGRADGPRLDDDGPRARGVVGFWRGAFVLDDGGGLVPLQADGRAPSSPVPAVGAPLPPAAPTPPVSPVSP